PQHPYTHSLPAPPQNSEAAPKAAARSSAADAAATEPESQASTAAAAGLPCRIPWPSMPQLGADFGGDGGRSGHRGRAWTRGRTPWCGDSMLLSPLRYAAPGDRRHRGGPAGLTSSSRRSGSASTRDRSGQGYFPFNYVCPLSASSKRLTSHSFSSMSTMVTQTAQQQRRPHRQIRLAALNEFGLFFWPRLPHQRQQRRLQLPLCFPRPPRLSLALCSASQRPPQSVEAEGEAAFESFEASASTATCWTAAQAAACRCIFADPDSSDADPPDTWRLFHRVEFSDEAAAAAAAGSPVELTAGGRHLCSADFYLADYRFRFHGDRLTEFSIAYSVRGPAKDYVSSTKFQPA
uniref:DUF6314 domain-containing protein n=1 Tax=Macrostomum lignano TaxID=282301 RepID=A0A1I8IYF9_9PLAT